MRRFNKLLAERIHTAKNDSKLVEPEVAYKQATGSLSYKVINQDRVVVLTTDGIGNTKYLFRKELVARLRQIAYTPHPKHDFSLARHIDHSKDKKWTFLINNKPIATGAPKDIIEFLTSGPIREETDLNEAIITKDEFLEKMTPVQNAVIQTYNQINNARARLAYITRLQELGLSKPVAKDVYDRAVQAHASANRAGIMTIVPIFRVYNELKIRRLVEDVEEDDNEEEDVDREREDKPRSFVIVDKTTGRVHSKHRSRADVDVVLNKMSIEDRKEYKIQLEEAAYKGNIGFEELYQFHQAASTKERGELNKLIRSKKFKEAWTLVKKVTKTNLVGLGETASS